MDKRNRWITFSQAQRTVQCPLLWAITGYLPKQTFPHYVHAAAQRGIRIHTSCSDFATRKTENIGPIQTEMIVRDSYEESAFSIDMETGEVCKIALDSPNSRDYDKDDGGVIQKYLSGKIDSYWIEEISGEEIGFVIDRKTGRTPSPPANNNIQLLLGSYCVAKFHNLKYICTYIQNIDRGGAIVEDPCEVFSFGTLEQRVGEIIQTLSVAVGIRNELESGATVSSGLEREGSHCSGCPAKRVCPAKTGLSIGLSNGELEIEL